MSRAAVAARKTVTAAQWASKGVYSVTCPSGALVKIRIPDTAALLREDALPDDLRGAAMRVVSALMQGKDEFIPLDEEGKPQITAEELLDLNAFVDRIVCAAVVEPVLTPEMLADPATRPPEEDLVMITQIASRKQDQDAHGVYIGEDPLAVLRAWQRTHGCVEGCEHCAQVRAGL